MKILPQLVVSILLSSGMPGRAAPLPAADAVPPVATIIDQVVARDSATQRALQSLEYRQTLTTERLDTNGKVMQQQEVQMIVRPGADQEIQVTSEKGDNLPGNPDEAALQAQGHKAQKQKIDFELKDIVNRFHIALRGTDTIQNQPVYVLSFEPKAGQPYRNQTEKVMNHLHGRIWVSTKDYSILKTDASLAEPVEILWVFADISALSFHYELTNAAETLGPSSIQTSVKVDAPLLAIRQRMTVDITKVEPRTKS